MRLEPVIHRLQIRIFTNYLCWKKSTEEVTWKREINAVV